MSNSGNSTCKNAILIANCGELSRVFFGQSIALRFLQTSQNEFPLVTRRMNRDTSLRAILHRHEFAGFGCPERVSGTCARKEGLRILTSPRREASLFKLGRSPRVPANFFCASVEAHNQLSQPRRGVIAAARHRGRARRARRL